jgi:hypothetical protein
LAGVDVQRSATPLEKTLTALGTTNYLSAGAVDAMTGGGPIWETVPKALREHTTYGDLLRKRGVTNGWVSGLAGFGLDVALDPLTWTGVGTLLKAGKLAKAAEMASRIAKLSGDADDIAHAARLADEVAKAGIRPFVEGLGAQAEAEHRALVTFGGFGHNVDLVKGTKILGALDKAGAAMGGAGKVGAVARGAESLVQSEPELKGLDREVFKAMKARIGGQERLAVQEVQKRISPVMAGIREEGNRLGIDPAQMDRHLADAIELGAKAPDPSLQPLFDVLERESEDISSTLLKRSKDAGIEISEVAGLGYLRHKVRPEAAEIIEKFGPDEFRGVGREVTERHGAQMRRSLVGAFDRNDNLVRLGVTAEETAQLAGRNDTYLKWRPLTRNEANDLAEKGELAITGYQPVKGGLFEDVGTATALRASEGAKAIGGAELIRGYAETPGMAENLAKIADAGQRKLRKVELIRQGWRTVPNNIKGVGEDVLFRGDIGSALARRGEKILPPDNRTLRSIAKGYDEGLRAWKSWTLGVFPVFHTRNEVDDLFRAIGYGGMDFRRLGDAARVSAWGTRLWRGGPEPVFFAKGGARYTATELKNLMLKWGVVDTGQMSEVLNQLGALARPKGMLEHAADNRVVNAGKEFGRVRENWTRSALFLDGLKRGMSPGEAAARTAKYLFDYGDLSKVEQQFMRRLFPFYTYTRKNIPIQLENLVAKPGLAAGVEKARQESSQGEGLGLPGGVSLNSKLRESLPMRVGRTKEGNPQFLRLAGQLGLSDLNSVMSPYGVVQKAEDLLTPALSTPIEIAKNYDTYRDAPMEDYPGQQTNLVGVPVSSRYGYPLLTNFRPLSELDRLLALKKDYAVPSTGERIANLVVGRTYAADPGALAARQAMATEREVRRLQMFLRRAKSPQEAQKIVKEIQRVIAHPERLK